jgi:hypothetical protein
VFSFKKRTSIAAVMTAALAFLMSGCAGGRHYHVVAEGPGESAAHYLELGKPASVATLHFPAGVYTLQAADDVGWYYRAPRKVLQHTGGASVPRSGGIYVNKRNPRKMRGYVYLAGGLIHIGDLSRARHEFRN